MKRAFSLIELMIVVAILGILAAVVMPTLQGHITTAKESAAKDNLRILRNAIDLYAAQHNGTPPGYFPGMTFPSFPFFILQMTHTTNIDNIHSLNDIKNSEFRYGPYLSKIPSNSFNDKTEFVMLADDTAFPGSATGNYGWIYKPATREIRLDWPGKDKDGVRYYDY